jgi:hypothetical protein
MQLENSGRNQVSSYRIIQLADREHQLADREQQLADIEQLVQC